MTDINEDVEACKALIAEMQERWGGVDTTFPMRRSRIARILAALEAAQAEVEHQRGCVASWVDRHLASESKLARAVALLSDVRDDVRDVPYQIEAIDRFLDVERHEPR